MTTKGQGRVVQTIREAIEHLFPALDQNELRSGLRYLQSIHRTDYIRHLHQYVYGLKVEAEERSRSLLTATALYIAAVAWVAKTLTDFHVSGHHARHYAVLVGLIFVALGTLAIVLTTFFTMRVFMPTVIDATSPMEPKLIIEKPSKDYQHELASLSERDIDHGLAQEIQAVSLLQIRRSNLVGWAAKTFIGGAAMLLGALIATVVAFVTS